MHKVKKEMRPYMVHAGCDECPRGFMEVMSVTLLSHPAHYPHECNFCGNKENLPKAYPCIEYEEIKHV